MSDHTITKEECAVGKGDKRTKRGKIWRGSYGKPRPRDEKPKAPTPPPAKPPAR